MYLERHNPRKCCKTKNWYTTPRNLPSSELIFCWLLMDSFVPVLFNEVDDVFLAPITLIRCYVSISWSKVNSWVAFNIKVLIRDIISSCILQGKIYKSMDQKNLPNWTLDDVKNNIRSLQQIILCTSILVLSSMPNTPFYLRKFS